MEPCRRGRREVSNRDDESARDTPPLCLLCFLQQITQPTTSRSRTMNADLLAMLSGGGLGGMPGGAGGANPAEESGTELLRFKAGRMKAELQQVRFFGRKFALAFDFVTMTSFCIASWRGVSKRMGFFKRAVSWRIESFIEHMNLFLARVRAPHRKYHSEVMLKLLINQKFSKHGMARSKTREMYVFRTASSWAQVK